MRPRQNYGSKTQTIAQGRLQAKMMLTAARTIDDWTPAKLAHCYHIPEREAEAMLNAENARRNRLTI